MNRVNIIQNQDGYPLKDDFMITQYCDSCHASILARINIVDQGLSTERIIDPVCSLCKVN
jgi:hypothetical protein